jgi:hypothetical protein
MHGKKAFLSPSHDGFLLLFFFSSEASEWIKPPLPLGFTPFFQNYLFVGARQFQSRVGWARQRDALVWWFCRYPYSEYHDFFPKTTSLTVSHNPCHCKCLDYFSFVFLRIADMRWVGLHIYLLYDVASGTFDVDLTNDRQSRITRRCSSLHKLQLLVATIFTHATSNRSHKVRLPHAFTGSSNCM